MDNKIKEQKEKKEKCPNCDGLGMLNRAKGMLRYRTCPICKGKGQIKKGEVIIMEDDGDYS